MGNKHKTSKTQTQNPKPSKIAVVARRCLGYAEHEGKCQNAAGTPWTQYWCDRCDKIRRETITKSLEKMVASF